MKLNKKAYLVGTLAFVFSVSLTAIAASSINLGAATGFAVLAGSTITNTGATVIEGALGLSPGTSVTGFPPGTVSGSQHITDANALQAQTDLTAAYNNAEGQGGVIAIAGNLGGQTLTPGVYNSASSIELTGELILDGGGNLESIFIFQAGSTLTTDSASSITLINGAQACHVYWQVGSSATLGTDSEFVGTLMALTSITLTSGASVDGRVLARNGAVTLDNNTIALQGCVVEEEEEEEEDTTSRRSPSGSIRRSVPTVAGTSTVIAISAPVFLAAAPTVTPIIPNTGTQPASGNVLLIISGILAIGGLVTAIANRKKVLVENK